MHVFVLRKTIAQQEVMELKTRTNNNMSSVKTSRNPSIKNVKQFNHLVMCLRHARIIQIASVQQEITLQQEVMKLKTRSNNNIKSAKIY